MPVPMATKQMGEPPTESVANIVHNTLQHQLTVVMKGSIVQIKV